MHIKRLLVNIYRFIKYSKARNIYKKGIRFDDYLPLNLKWLSEEKIETIIDVGAYTGQFALIARELFPNAHIHSFEPLPIAYQALVRTFSNDQTFNSYNEAFVTK
jgi:hypothetical protein